jgi:hypothetical protein
MKGKKGKDKTAKKYNPTLHDVNRARERQEFIDPEMGPENKGRSSR